MNKHGLITAVSEKTKLPQKTVRLVIETMISQIRGALATNEKVTIKGFGTWMVKERRARKIRNPRTGETMIIQASVTPIFRPTKSFKKFVQRWISKNG